MALISLTDAFCYVAGYDFTTDTNNAMLNTEVAQLDKTTFGSSGWTELEPGLKSVSMAYSGFWQAASTGDQAVDNQAFPMLATSQAYSFGPVETEGSPAYMFQASKAQYALGGNVGELMPFSLSATGSSGVGMVRGQLAKSRGSVSAIGALGSAVDLGTSGNRVYAVFHVFSAGTTITLDIEASNGGAWSTIGTVGPLTTSGGTWVTPISYGGALNLFRFNVTAITGTFTVAGSIARA